MSGCWAPCPGTAPARQRVGWGGVGRAVLGCGGRITGGNEIAGRKWQSPTESLSGEYLGSKLGWSRAAFNTDGTGKRKLGDSLRG